jgi:hypothetical protein
VKAAAAIILACAVAALGSGGAAAEPGTQPAVQLTTTTPAQQLVVQPVPDQDAVVAPLPQVELAYAVSNTGAEPLTLTLGALRAGPTMVATAWRRLDTGEVVQGEVPLAVKGRVVLILSATVPQPGRYLVAITSRAAKGPPVTRELVVDRRARTPAVGVMIAPPDPLQVDAAFLFWPPATARIAFNVQNPTTAPIVLRQPFVSAASRTIDKSVRDAGLDAVTGNFICAGNDEGADLVVLGPGDGCRGIIPIAVTDPGAYRIKVASNGAEGGLSSVDLTLNVRASIWWAVLLALTAAGLGSWMAGWRARGRAKLVAQAAIAAESDRVAAAERLGLAAHLNAPTETLNIALKSLWDEVEADREQDPETKLAPLRQRRRRVEEWVAAAQSVGEVNVNAQGPLLAEARDIRRALEDGASLDADVAASLEKLRADVEQAQAGALAASPLVAAVVLPRRLSVPSAVPPPPHRSLKALRALLWRNDLVAHVVVGGVVCAGAITATWLPNPAWGGLGDMIALFLATAGVQTGGVGLVSQAAAPTAPLAVT